MKYFFTNLGTFYSEHEANVNCVPFRRIGHLSLRGGTSDRLLFQSCIRNKHICCLVTYMIDWGKELANPHSFSHLGEGLYIIVIYM